MSAEPSSCSYWPCWSCMSSPRPPSSCRNRAPMSSNGSANIRRPWMRDFIFSFPSSTAFGTNIRSRKRPSTSPSKSVSRAITCRCRWTAFCISRYLNPQRASYGISDYHFALVQLAQTTLRSEIGKIELDRTFEERTNINIQVVNELDKASDPWGVKVLRYEIKNITPPKGVLDAMEKQMRAEREKRAVILTSEGERDAAINQAEGEKQQVIKASEAKKQQQINEAEGAAAQPSSPSRKPPPKDCARSPRPFKSPEVRKRSSCGSPNSTSPNLASWPRPTTRSFCRRASLTSDR